MEIMHRNAKTNSWTLLEQVCIVSVKAENHFRSLIINNHDEEHGISSNFPSTHRLCPDHAHPGFVHLTAYTKTLVLGELKVRKASAKL